MPKKAKTYDEPSQAEAMEFMYQVLVNGQLDLRNEWNGWKLRGPYLVAPNGDRILPQRLLGLLYTEKLQKRVYQATKANAAAKAKPAPLADLGVVVMPRRRVA